ncbi:MAG: SOS response-associated peptidase family protein [Microbacteriaceae bacterium]
MCASYGLGGGPREAPVPSDLPPLDEEQSRAQLLDWAADRKSNARLTGPRARNLNPLIFADRGGARSLEFSWWWLWLDGHGKAPFDAFNARDDKLLSTWRKYLTGGKRALIPATWYVEKGKAFELPGGATFGMAAITHAVVEEASGKELITYALVTRDAVDEAAKVHKRMPMLLPRDEHDTWLDPGRPGDSALVEQVVVASEELAHAVRVIEAEPKQPAEPETPTLF